MTASSEETVLLEKRDGLGIVTINRPKKANAMRLADYDAFTDRVRECDESSDVRVIIITGAGEKYFTVGDDYTDYTGDEIMRMREMNAFERHRHEYPNVEAGLRLWRSAKPSIAAINGACLMPEFIWWTDLRIMAEHATIAENQVLIGVTPSVGGTQLLPRLVGRSRALEILLLGERITAAEALQLGLVNAVVPLDELMPMAESWAARLMKSTPAAIAMTKLAVNAAQDAPLEWGMHVEKFASYTSELSADIWKRTEDFIKAKEGDVQGGEEGSPTEPEDNRREASGGQRRAGKRSSRKRA